MFSGWVADAICVLVATSSGGWAFQSELHSLVFLHACDFMALGEESN